MFFRTKTSGPRSYLQIVENRWEDGQPRQRVIATLGRLDQLQQSGHLVEQDGKRFLLRSDAKGTCGKVFQTVDVAIPPTVQQAEPTAPDGGAAHSATPAG